MAHDGLELRHRPLLRLLLGGRSVAETPPPMHVERMSPARRALPEASPGDPALLQLVTSLDRRVFALEERVRQLELEKASAPSRVAATVAAPTPAPPPEPTMSLHRDRERAKMLKALEACGWNKKAAADKISMPRRTFYRRMEDYGIK